MGGCFSKEEPLHEVRRSAPGEPAAKAPPQLDTFDAAVSLDNGVHVNASVQGLSEGGVVQKPSDLDLSTVQPAAPAPIPTNPAVAQPVGSTYMEQKSSVHVGGVHASNAHGPGSGNGVARQPSSGPFLGSQPGLSAAGGSSCLVVPLHAPDNVPMPDPADPMLQPINTAAVLLAANGRPKATAVRTASGYSLSSDTGSSDSDAACNMRHRGRAQHNCGDQHGSKPRQHMQLSGHDAKQTTAQAPVASNGQAAGATATAAGQASVPDATTANGSSQIPPSPFAAAAAAGTVQPSKPPISPFVVMAAASGIIANGAWPSSNTLLSLPSAMRPHPVSTGPNPFLQAATAAQQGVGSSTFSLPQTASFIGSQAYSEHSTGSPLPPRPLTGSLPLGVMPLLNPHPSELISCSSSVSTSLPLESGEGGCYPMVVSGAGSRNGEGTGLRSAVGGSNGTGTNHFPHAAPAAVSDGARVGEQQHQHHNGGDAQGVATHGTAQGGWAGQPQDGDSAEGSAGRSTGGTALPDAMVLRACLPPELAERPATMELKRVEKEIKGLKWLGQGAGGVVYKGFWRDVPVAIKFMLSSNPDHLNEKYREAILARFVSHPNVVQTYTYDRAYINEAIVKHARSNALAGPRPLSGESLNKSLNLFDNADGTISTTGTQTFNSSLGTNPAAGSPSGGAAGGHSITSDARGGGSGRGDSLPATAATAASPAVAAGPEGRRLVTISGSGVAPVSQNGVASLEGSRVSEGFGDPEGSLAAAGGWSLGDVLVHMGAQQGQYLTHIIMELCDAGTLLKAIKSGAFVEEKAPRGSQYHLRAVLRTAREVARGVAFLHSLNIIHGDLKPGNVLLRSSTEDKRGFVAKVADFGLARTMQPHDELHKVDELQGTPVYLAPEVVKDGTISKSADVYALGMLLWQMVTGQQPFAGLGAAQIMYGKQQGTLSLQWPANMYSPLRKLGELCLDSDPRARPTAEQVTKALVKIEQHLHKKVRSSSGSSASSSSNRTASHDHTTGSHLGGGTGGTSHLTSGRGHPVGGGVVADVATQVGVLPRVMEQSNSSLSQSGNHSSGSLGV